ncbi:39S ribosomal protein L40, mitochondrial [Halotydeus destructor]|nr:39S ribosomal protein L40, mitochondrial [Halotydeus destructor]
MLGSRLLQLTTDCLHQYAFRTISTTQIRCAQPPKKKKKMDISLVKVKVDRKVKKLEKEIKKMRKTPKQLKPVDEYVLSSNVIKTLNQRRRKPSNEDKKIDEDLRNLTKIWNEYRKVEAEREKKAIRRVMDAQEKAMQQLKSVNLDLYMAALEIDDNLLPFKDDNIIKLTTKHPEYEAPDGRRSDATKQWAM